MCHTSLIWYQAVKKESPTDLDRLKGNKMTFGQESQLRQQSHKGTL